jgi:hypothetical protein
MGHWRDEAKRCPLWEAYRTSWALDKQGGSRVTQRDKAPRKTHHARVIRADPELLIDHTPDPLERVPAALRQPRRTRRTPTKSPEHQAFSPPSPIPAWARASGRAGRSAICGRRRARFARRGPARPPRAQSAAASAKILRLNGTQPRCVTCASPSAIRSGLRQTCCRCGAMAPVGRPASTPAAETGSPSPAQAFRPIARPFGSGRTRSSRGREGRSFSASQTPQRPRPRFWRFGCSTSFS